MERDQLDIARLNAEINKMMEETLKARTERIWYPFAAGAGVTLAIVAVLSLLFKLLLHV
jgi:hypothetical protein